MSVKQFQPFEDDAAVFSYGGLQLENGPGRVVMFGELKFGRDQSSKRAALALAEVLRAIAAGIDDAAPESVAEEVVAVVEEVANPFA